VNDLCDPIFIFYLMII